MVPFALVDYSQNTFSKNWYLSLIVGCQLDFGSFQLGLSASFTYSRFNKIFTCAPVSNVKNAPLSFTNREIDHSALVEISQIS